MGNEQQPLSAMRLGGLDGLRGIAACLVAFGFHIQFLFDRTHLPHWLTEGIPGWLMSNGWTGVDLFFVLSGFVFAHVYLRARALSTRAEWADFAIARFARLYPLHLATLLFTAIALWFWPGNTLPAFIAHLLMLQALAPPVGYSFNGPAWSISVEMFCYMLFALGLAGGERRLTIISIVSIAISTYILLTFGPGHYLEPIEVLARGLLGFFVGLTLWRVRDKAMSIPAWILALIALAGFYIPTGNANVTLPMTLLTWPATLLLALRWRAFAVQPLLWLGDRSYAIYLIHMPLIHIGYFATHKSLQPTISNILMAYVVFVPITLLLANGVYRYFEVPVRDYIRRSWTARRMRGQMS